MYKLLAKYNGATTAVQVVSRWTGICECLSIQAVCEFTLAHYLRLLLLGQW